MGGRKRNREGGRGRERKGEGKKYSYTASPWKYVI